MADPLWSQKFRIIKKHGIENKVLDLGCHEGIFSSRFVKLGYDVAGVDVDEKKLRLAKRKGLKAIKCDLNKKIPLPGNSFKTILALEIIEHIVNPENLVREAYRLLKRDGKFYISTPYFGLIKRTLVSVFFFDNIFGYKTNHIRFFSEKSFKELLTKNNFRILKLYKLGRLSPFSMDMFAVCVKR